MLTMRDDHELVDAAARGERAAFAALIDRHYDRLLRIAWQRTGNRADAEDIVQAICVALPGRLAQFRGEAKVSTWLTRIALNAAKDHMRARQREHARNHAWADLRIAQEAVDAETRERRAWLAQAMRALPEEIRDTVVLICGEGLSQAEAAEVLEVAPGTVAWRISEAKRRLRDIAMKEQDA